MAGVKGRSGGHNRKPTPKLKAEGGYRATRHRDRADESIKAVKLRCPTHLKAIGKKTWKRITDALPDAMITNLDPDSLAIYCDLTELYAKLRPQFMADPIDKDLRIAYMACIDHMDKVGRQFGWTPQSRASLQLPKNDKAEESVFDSLLARMSGNN